jgi:hypothetical protein
MARRKAEEALGLYDRMLEDYKSHMDPGGPVARLDNKFGRYSNDGLKLYLDIRPTDRSDKAGEYVLNGMQTRLQYLEHFRQSTFGFIPPSREEQEARCMVDYVSYDQFLLTFDDDDDDDDDGKHNRLEWIMQPGLDPIVFVRRS